MRKTLVPLCTLAMSLTTAAHSQTVDAPQPPQPAAGGEGAPAPAAAALSPEDQNASPFPAAPNASLVNKVCTQCHSASRVLDLRYTREDAESFYKNMVSDDVTTEQAQKIIAYLTTTLAP